MVDVTTNVNALAARIADEFNAVRAEMGEGGGGGDSRVVVADEGVYTRPAIDGPVIFVGPTDPTAEMESGDLWHLTEDLAEPFEILGQYSGTGNVSFTPTGAEAGDLLILSITEDSADQTIPPEDGFWGYADWADDYFTANTYGGRLQVWGKLLTDDDEVTATVTTPANTAWVATVFHTKKQANGASWIEIQPTGTTFTVPASALDEPRYLVTFLSYSSTPAIPTDYPDDFTHIVTAGADGRRVIGALTTEVGGTGTTTESVDIGMVDLQFSPKRKYLSGTYTLTADGLAPAEMSTAPQSGTPADFYYSLGGVPAPGWYTDLEELLRDIRDKYQAEAYPQPYVVGLGNPAGVPNYYPSDPILPPGEWDFTNIIFKSLIPNTIYPVTLIWSSATTIPQWTNYKIRLDGVSLVLETVDEPFWVPEDGSGNLEIELSNNASLVNVGPVTPFRFTGWGNVSIASTPNSAETFFESADPEVPMVEFEDHGSVTVRSDSPTGTINPASFAWTNEEESGYLNYYATGQTYTGGMSDTEAITPENATYYFYREPSLLADTVSYYNPDDSSYTSVQEVLEGLLADGGGSDAPDLQAVTEEGATTTNAITVVDVLGEGLTEGSTVTSGGVQVIQIAGETILAVLSATMLSFAQGGDIGILSPPTLGGDRAWLLPDASGTVALTSDIKGIPTYYGDTLPDDPGSFVWWQTGPGGALTLWIEDGLL